MLDHTRSPVCIPSPVPPAEMEAATAEHHPSRPTDNNWRHISSHNDTFPPSLFACGAECISHQDHTPINRCRCTRTSKPSDSNPTAGRPLGLLAAWAMELSSEFDSREEHTNPFTPFLATYEMWQKCRLVLTACPGGAKLASSERAHAAGEGIEPVDHA